MKIDKGLEIPEVVRSLNEEKVPNWKKFPFEKLEVGDSFALEIGKPNSRGQIMGYLVNARTALHPKLFVSRTVTEDDKQKIRIWRTH